MKYKVGDKVRVRSKEWYDRTKSRYGDIECGNFMFYQPMSHWCGEIITIAIVFDGFYKIKEDNGIFKWTDEMIEGLVEEKTKPTLSKNAKLVSERFAEEVNVSEFKPHQDEIMKLLLQGALNIPEGYIFKDENGNVITATKIVLEKKKKEYPKTYEECCKVLSVSEFEYNHTGTKMWYRHKLMATLDNLMICRDAYWKIAGEEMGLGKPWEPDFDNLSTNLEYIKIVKGCFTYSSRAFAFPTEEMRDAFKENFKELIEQCKELL